jgi:SAM-dependent methyltransferase
MSGFSAAWLALREPYDTRARNADVLSAVAALFKQRDFLRIVDLACGTGSSARALGPRLAARQSWRLVDNDHSLLAEVASMPGPKNVAVSTVALDLARDLEAALEGHFDLVSASALLDLVSDTWLERLAVQTAARSISVYATLSYDGRIEFVPPDPLDAAIVAAVNAHQRTDKGFGPALGPAAAAAAIAHFKSLGYSVVQGASDWTLGPDDRGMQLEVLAGWANATYETGKLTVADTATWLTRRRNAVTAGLSSIRVGHVDFFATPTHTR